MRTIRTWVKASCWRRPSRLCGSAHAQKIKTENLPNFDLRRFHFGFLLSYNTSDFYTRLNPNAPFTDSLLVVDHVKQPGFNLGIVSSLNMTPNLSLRFLPSLSFQDRQLKYSFRKSDGKTTVFFQKPIESTYLEFPLLMKLRSDRITNFAVYLLGGGKFSIDMASQKDVNQALDDETIKLRRTDYSAEIGGGVDMFLPYFKFGLELKMGIGIPNLLIDDNTRFSAPIESLRSKTYMFTFTFEG
ncbi:MAG: PorT family protein [Flavobacteriales bacterium]|nr:PorT family protein [Flavobacteriales bacterium]